MFLKTATQAFEPEGRGGFWGSFSYKNFLIIKKSVYSLWLKGTVKQIEKALINVSKVSENFAFELFIILQ